MSATYTSTGEPQGFEFLIRMDTFDEAAATEIASRFPKSARLRVTTLSFSDGRPKVSYIIGRGNLVANGANGGINETGAKRYHTLIRAAAKAGVSIRWEARWGNSYPSAHAFETAI